MQTSKQQQEEQLKAYEDRAELLKNSGAIGALQNNEEVTDKKKKIDKEALELSKKIKKKQIKGNEIVNKKLPQ